MKMKTLVTILFVVIVVFIVTACDGGNGGSNSSGGTEKPVDVWTSVEEQVIFSQEGITMTFTDISDRYIGYTAYLTIVVQNNTERDVQLIPIEAAVNGIELVEDDYGSLGWGITGGITGGKVIEVGETTEIHLAFRESRLEDLKINELDDISVFRFELAVYDGAAIWTFGSGDQSDHFIMNTGVIEIMP